MSLYSSAKLHFLKGTTQTDINLYTAESDVGSPALHFLYNNVTLHAKLVATNSLKATALRVKYNNKDYAASADNSMKIKLTNSYYKMSDLYPDIYKTMTEVPDELDTSALTTGESMFSGCEKLQKIPSINTSKMKNIKWMFANCSSVGAQFYYLTLNLKSVTSLSNVNGAFSGTHVAGTSTGAMIAVYVSNYSQLKKNGSYATLASELTNYSTRDYVKLYDASTRKVLSPQ